MLAASLKAGVTTASSKPGDSSPGDMGVIEM